MANKEHLPRLTGQYIQQMYENERESIWSDDQMLMIRRRGAEAAEVFKIDRSLQTTYTHIGIVTQGSAYLTVNLHHYNIKKGSMFVITPESVMQMQNQTDDLDMQIIHVSDDKLASVIGRGRLQFFRQRMDSFGTQLSKEHFSILLALYDTLWMTLHSDILDCRDGLLSSLVTFIRNIYKMTNNVEDGKPENRNMQVFNRFLNLVNEHCDEHRDLDYYADLICLNKQYLSTIISDVSRQPASKWIEEAVVKRIKVMLRHEDISLNEISKKMSFPEPSNFSRYFKRLTGMTPAEYRKNGQAEDN